jgi:hypothetical protein
MNVDWRTDGPSGKNWIKVTYIHYLDKSSVKKVSSTIYQATLCNKVQLPRIGIIWNYFRVRVDCKSRQGYTERIHKKEWIGPIEISNSGRNYFNAVLRYVCK